MWVVRRKDSTEVDFAKVSLREDAICERALELDFVWVFCLEELLEALAIV